MLKLPIRKIESREETSYFSCNTDYSYDTDQPACELSVFEGSGESTDHKPLQSPQTVHPTEANFSSEIVAYQQDDQQEFQENDRKDSNVTERRKLLRKSISKLSLVVKDKFNESLKYDLVRMYNAVVLWDYDPPAVDDCVILSLSTSQNLMIYGTSGITQTTVSSIDHVCEHISISEIYKDINLGDGWCQADNEFGETGFVPISYLHFAEETGQMSSEVPVEVKSTQPSAKIPSHAFLTSNGSSKVVPTSRAMSLFELVILQASESVQIGSLISSLLPVDPILDYVYQYNKNYLPVHTGRFSAWCGSRTSVISNIPYNFAINVSSNGLEWLRKVSIGPIVHSPMRRELNCNSFITFKVTSTISSNTITVDRRFSDFRLLHTILNQRYPAQSISIPHLPAKRFFGSKFASSHVLSRQKALQIYLSYLLGHPILQSDPIILDFLCQSGLEKSELSVCKYFEDQIFDWDADCSWSATELTAPKGMVSFLDRLTVPYYLSFNQILDSDLVLFEHERTSMADMPLSAFIHGIENYQKECSNMANATNQLCYALESFAIFRFCPVEEHRSVGCWKSSCKECRKLGKSILAANQNIKSIAKIRQAHVFSADIV